MAIVRAGQGENPGIAYMLNSGETVGCYFCIQQNNHASYGRGEAVLCDAGCPPYDANANYVCMSCLVPSIEIRDVSTVVIP